MKLDMKKYVQIRMAQAKGARTLDELNKIANISIENNEEVEHIIAVLNNACSCHKLSIEEVLESIHNGADTMDKLVKATNIGTCCGRCKPLADNILETRR